MDLVQRYVQSVRSLLPRAQQDDIAEELDGAIRGRIEEREAELGRALTNSEIETILKTFGHPIAAAGRYAPQRHLIGPEIFPFWWIAAKIVVVVAAIAGVANGLGRAVSNPPMNLMGAFGMAWETFWTTGLFLIGLITVIGAVLEHYKIKPLENWRAKDLGSFAVGSAWPPQAADRTWGGRARRPRSRASAAAAVFGGLITVAIWALVPIYVDRLPAVFNPMWWLGLWGITLTGGQLWVLWGLLLVQAIAQTGVYLADLIYPGAVRPRAAAAAATNGLVLAVVLLSLKFTGLLYLPFPTAAQIHAMSTADRIEHGFQLALVVIALITAIALAYDLYRLATGRRIGSAAAPQ